MNILSAVVACAIRPARPTVYNCPPKCPECGVCHRGVCADPDASRAGILLALYRGRSPISRCIQWATRSPYSHAAMVDAATGKTFEAWHNPGHFRALPSPWTMHDPGTEIEFYAVAGMTASVALDIRKTCEVWAASGIRYDYWQIARFLTRSTRGSGPEEAFRLFCSEACVLAFRWAGLPFINSPASRTAPHHLLWSPMLHRVRPDWLPPPPS